MAIPVVFEDQCVAVVTLYSTHADAFSEDQERIIEAVCRHTAPAIHASLGIPSSSGNNEVRINKEPRNDAILYIRLGRELSDDDETQGIATSIFDALNEEIRSPDTIIRPSNLEFVVVLRGLNESSATAARDRIRDRIITFVNDTGSFDTGQVFVAPLVTASAELGEETMIRLARGEQSPPGDTPNGNRVH